MADGSRRQVLAAGGALAGTALGVGALSGCGGDPGEGGTGNGKHTRGSGSQRGFTLVALDEVPVGGAVSAEDTDGNPLIVARPTEDTAVCFSAICTHAGCTVAPKGKELDCPCHGSVYQATTGKNISGPAQRPLAKVPVTVTNGKVVTA